jgi:hypothetical protein
MHSCEALPSCSCRWQIGEVQRSRARTEHTANDAFTQIRKVSYHIMRLSSHHITSSQANGRGGFLAVTCLVPLMLMKSKHLQHKRERTTHRDCLINDQSDLSILHNYLTPKNLSQMHPQNLQLTLVLILLT